MVRPQTGGLVQGAALGLAARGVRAQEGQAQTVRPLHPPVATAALTLPPLLSRAGHKLPSPPEAQLDNDASTPRRLSASSPQHRRRLDTSSPLITSTPHLLDASSPRRSTPRRLSASSPRRLSTSTPRRLITSHHLGASSPRHLISSTPRRLSASSPRRLSTNISKSMKCA